MLESVFAASDSDPIGYVTNISDAHMLRGVPIHAGIFFWL